MKKIIFSGVIVATLITFYGCSSYLDKQMQDFAHGMVDGDTIHKGKRMMLDEIYSMKKPVGIEQIDVTETVLKYIQLGVKKEKVLEVLKEINITQIIENSESKVIARDNLGHAMIDYDARSIVMSFFFDSEKSLIKVDAVYLKSQ